MKATQGFSLMEVLVALGLISLIFLALYKQQWTITRLFNEAIVLMQDQIQQDNAYEKGV